MSVKSVPLFIWKMTLMPFWGFHTDTTVFPIHICLQNKFTLEIENVLQLETLPACQIWQKNMPPFAWTASTIGFHASTCSFVQIQGILLYLAMHTGNIVSFRDSYDNEMEHCVFWLQEAKKDTTHTPRSCIWNCSSFSNEKTSFGCSLFIIQYGVRLGDTTEGFLPCQWCMNHPKK